MLKKGDEGEERKLEKAIEMEGKNKKEQKYKYISDHAQ